MSLLENLLQSGIPINWMTIQIGWDGPGKFPRQLSIEDIASYAARVLEANSEQPIEVLKLAGAYSDEESTVEKYIRTLADREHTDIDVETRKWRLALLKNQMQALSDDPLYGLLSLTEFWEKFDYPTDGPHTVQGKDNSQAPQAYYSTSNFQHILDQHREWIDKEEIILQRAR